MRKERHTFIFNSRYLMVDACDLKLAASFLGNCTGIFVIDSLAFVTIFLERVRNKSTKKIMIPIPKLFGEVRIENFKIG